MPTEAPKPQTPEAATPVTAGQKRPLEIPTRDLPAIKRPSLTPGSPVPAGNTIPDTFHFAVAGALTSASVENIKAWVQANHPKKVVIWFDPGSRLANRLSHWVTKKTLTKVNYTPEALLNPDTFEEQLIKARNKQWSIIKPEDHSGNELDVSLPMHRS